MKMTLAGLVTVLTTSTAQAPSNLTIVVDGTSKTVTAAALQKLPRDTATMVFHEEPPMKYEGVRLTSVLREAGVRADSLRGPALTTRLVIEAKDGYKIVLTLAELDPSLGARRVLLADRVDGKPLPADEAPWRLIIPGDQRPARSARQVVTIRVLPEPR
jgi:hypothetical protein